MGKLLWGRVGGHKVSDRWPIARNLLAMQPKAQVLIVANAGAVAAALATADPVTDDCLRLCANTLRHRGLENTWGITEVAAAVQTLALLRSEGWAYIRA